MAQQLGDSVFVGNKKLVLTSTNLISNGGFENGFTGWTDGTAAPLSTNNFTMVNTGGVANSKYLVGASNTGTNTAGALSTGWKIEPGKIYYFSYQVKYQNTATTATPEIYLKISLTNNSNFQEETLKLIDTTLVESGGIWTRNAVSFTNTNPSYAYIMANFRWLNNRFGFDQFALHEAKEAPNKEGLQSLLVEAKKVYNVSAIGASALLSAIDAATALLTNSSADLVYQGISDLNAAILVYQLANASTLAPKVITSTNIARGATQIFARSTIEGNAGILKEHGFCWSTHPTPTIQDNKTTQYFTNNGFIYHIKNLTPATVYYVRAYVLTTDFAVGYGDIIKVITIPKGTVSYVLSSNVTQEHSARIDHAMSTAVKYFNELTSIKGLKLNVNYGSGTPTAEASYGGWMRFGPNASYQQTGTAQHEMVHTIGVGTHPLWSGPSSPLRAAGSSGAWLGDRTTKLLQFLDGDPAAYLRGDATHMWPYGINGAQEDNGTEFLYCSNALIAQALGEDGLPPTGGFATPAYTFEIKDDTKYYIKSENEQSGLNTSFVVGDPDGNLINRVMTPEAAIINDNAAWTFQFNPATGYYTIKNVGTGRMLTYMATGTSGIKTTATSVPGDDQYFQLMMGRIDVRLKSLTKRGYWIIHPENNNTPDCFTATTTQSTTSSDFNISNVSTTQRWLLLSADEVRGIGSVSAIAEEKEDNYYVLENKVYVQNRAVHVESGSPSADIMIYNANGILMTEANHINTSYSYPLPLGMYIVVIKSGTRQEARKILVY